MVYQNKFFIFVIIFFLLLAVACLSFFINSLYPLRRAKMEEDLARISTYENLIDQNPMDRASSQALLDNLSSPDQPVVVATLRTFGRIDSEYIDELSILEHYLNSSVPQYRRASILAVKDKGQESIVILPSITDSLSDPDAIDVRVFAAQVIRELGPEASSALEELRKARDDPTNSAFRSTFESAIENITVNEDDMAAQGEEN